MIRQLPTHRSSQASPSPAPTQRKTQQPALSSSGDGLHYARPPARLTATTGGQALPTGLRSGIESLSGMSMDGVRVHYGSPLPARLNALAYAQGRNIHLARGEEQHLPHEAWHVVQQMQGRVRATTRVEGMGVNDNASLEREADHMGDRAVQMKAAGSRSAGLARSGYAPAVVQRYLKVDTTDYTLRVKRDGEDVDAETQAALALAIAAVQPATPGTLENTAHTWLQANQVAAEAQLKKWVQDNKGGGVGGSHPEFGRKQQARIYANYHDLALALYGWMTAKQGRRDEKALATDINNSPIIEQRIDNVLIKIRTWIKAMGAKTATVKAGLKANADASGWADYIRWFTARGVLATDVPLAPYPVLKNPAAFSLREKVAILHDVMKFFIAGSGTAGTDILQEDGGGGLVPFSDFKATTATGKQTYTRPTSTIVKRTGLLNLAGPGSRPSDEETHPSFIYARSQGIPMWARHSYTAARMMRLAQQAGADKAEVAAVGYAIVAFWRVHYDHTSLPYHTLHEVLDFAPHFGTPYNPQTRYQDVRNELDPLAPLMLRLNAVIGSPNWNGKAHFNKGNKAPATIVSIRGVLAGGNTDGEKLDQIRPLVANKTGFNLLRSGKAADLYRILALLPVNTHDHYEAGTATRSQKERIATSLRDVLQGLNAFQP
jgi:hypothetical protein